MSMQDVAKLLATSLITDMQSVILLFLSATFVLSHPVPAPVAGIHESRDLALGLARGRESDPNHPIRLRSADLYVLQARRMNLP